MKTDRIVNRGIDVDGLAAEAEEAVHVFVRPGTVAASCAPTPTSPDFTRSRVLRYNGVGWDGLRAVVELDSDGASAGATHRRLSPAGAGAEIRYIELDTGGGAALDTAGTERTLVCIRGHGRIHLEGETFEIGFGDVVHIQRDEIARASNPYAEPFGLLRVSASENHDLNDSEADRAHT